ncbi:MAG: HAD-IB family phosphatase [Acidilobaceae archaeon]
MGSKLKLVIFDVDGVLTSVRNSWGFVHEVLGVSNKAKENFKLFLENKISYAKWMELDTRLWIEARGGRLHKSELLEVFSHIEIDSAARPVFDWLKKKNLKTALVSGGVDLWVERVAQVVEADYWLANKLSFDKEGYLVPGGIPIVGVWKDDAVKRIASHLNVSLSETMFIGDSIWDAPAMRIVGYPVGYGLKAREELKGIARYFINSLSELPNLIEAIELEAV